MSEGPDTVMWDGRPRVVWAVGYGPGDLKLHEGCEVLVLAPDGTRPPALAASPSSRVEAALDIANRYGGIDGEHHKTWVIDQMVRHLTGSGYAEWVRLHKEGDYGPDSYDWDEGIAP